VDRRLERARLQADREPRRAAGDAAARVARRGLEFANRQRRFLTRSRFFAALFLSLAACSAAISEPPSAASRNPAAVAELPPKADRSYDTRFPLRENPISEHGNWLNGGADGIDWTDVQTTKHMAFGTMPGNAYYPYTYADSTAVLAGSWGSNQTVRATLSVPNASNQYGVFEEVELRVRTSIVAHSIAGYEINCSVNTRDAYAQVVRWNGPLASFTELDGAGIGCADGDVLKATVAGKNVATITVYKNGVQILSVTDRCAPIRTGNPGIGFFLEGATGLDAEYGFRDFRASGSGK
jgi:hypothetical protein